MDKGRKGNPFLPAHFPPSSLKDLVGGYWSGDHLFPSRTEKLSPDPPMILGSNLVKQVAATIIKSNKSIPTKDAFCIYTPQWQVF